MADKRDDKNKNKKKAKKRVPRKRKGIVNHATTARWIQEQLLEALPELGYISEKLIEKILKLEHKRYISLGHTRVTFTSEDE